MPRFDLPALQRGEDAAWNEAWPELQKLAFPVVVERLSKQYPQDIEEVVAETLVALVGALKKKKVRSETHLIFLVRVIARNKALSHLRLRNAQRRGQGRTTSLDAITEDCGELPVCDDGNSPSNALEKHECSEWLERLQEMIPEKSRLVLGERLDGLSYAEIAELHGWAIGTVGAELDRVKKSLLKAACKLPQEIQDFLRSFL